MITVEELAGQATPEDGVVGDEVVVDVLTESERELLDFVDSEIEPIAMRMKGDVFDVVLSLSRVPFRVIAQLKKNWETGGWVVGVFRKAEDAVQVVFAKSRAGGPSSKSVQSHLAEREARLAEQKWEEGEREDVPISVSFSSRTEASDTSCPLLVRMPTRSRPEQALAALAAYREMAADPDLAIEVVLDEDDPTTNNVLFIQRLYALDCSVCFGRHKNKIEAVNSGHRRDWGVLVLASDDMWPVRRGYDRRILELMRQHWPLGDGAICLNDGYNRDHVLPGKPVLCTLPVMGRHLYDQFGYVYHPGYGSIYVDNEQTEILTAMNRLVFVDEVLIEHRHHAAGKAPHDVLYRHNDGKYGLADKALFEARAGMRREGSQFAFDAPPMLLSILVCSTESRARKLRKLVRYLRDQMRPFSREVELVVEIDRGEMTVGAKRQKLLERARGHYVAFVDDDDMVSSDYVARILRVLKENPGTDCLSLWGVMTTPDGGAEKFTHSLSYDRWYTDARTGTHVRSPNHLSVLRREVALEVGFVSKDVGEDHDFSSRIRPLLKCEASTGVEPLYFYFYDPRQSVQSQKKGG